MNGLLSVSCRLSPSAGTASTFDGRDERTVVSGGRLSVASTGLFHVRIRYSGSLVTISTIFRICALPRNSALSPESVLRSFVDLVLCARESLTRKDGPEKTVSVFIRVVLPAEAVLRLGGTLLTHASGFADTRAVSDHILTVRTHPRAVHLVRCEDTYVIDGDE